MFELKPLSQDAIPDALDRAVRYRVLNEPREAESICLDILAIEPENQKALVNLLLALTDQFPDGLASTFGRAKEVHSKLTSEFDRAYYKGIICERRAKTAYKKQTPRAGYIAYDWLRKAMTAYEEAERMGEEGSAKAVLRWNTCARTIMNNRDIEESPDGAESLVMLE